MGNQDFGTYGFRFAEKEQLPLLGLYALGFERAWADYEWDGRKRLDGPLYLLQYTVSGWGELHMEGQTRRIGPGEAFLVDIPGDHRYALPKESGEWTFYFILFRQKHADALWTSIVSRLGRVVRFEKDSPAMRVLSAAFADAAAGRITDAYSASSLVYRLLMELARHERDKPRHVLPAPVQQAIAFMQANYGSPISIAQVAEAAGVSKYHFIRLFARETRYTPLDYLTRLRIQRAAELLQSSDWVLERIATECGFASGSYFSKVFRQWVGCTPGEYRLGRDVLAARRLTFD
ncbi:AraC family transcriptional regulator [Paenibacillus methanolicus]|uniref:AraC-like protein n=1 Tax=Paenibacillus methanolicus TaxID=582686 RepID=A0A5S5C7I0_9BACL|nr:AraC family transcriptional regulator [Paenibacillus methanolicus]TYP73943.1 AraC-like protein [Paenibacillus methanolicus]